MLGLSQGSVSELLSKPKPWHMLSIKGREPFIRMQLWLNDPSSVDKLQVLKNEHREGIKRKRIGTGGAGSGSGFDSSSDRSSPADPSDFGVADSPGGGGGGGGSAKKQKLLLSEEQKEALKVAFALDPYPASSIIDFLAQDLGLDSRSVSAWFHGHRLRLKASPNEALAAALAAREGSPQGTFDPVKYKLLCHQRILEMQQEQQDHPVSQPSNSVTNFLRQLGLPTVGMGMPPAVAAAAGAGGLDLSLGKLAKEAGDRDSIAASSEDDEDSRGASATTTATPLAVAVGRSSRRKPAAPQWVRPQEEQEGGGEAKAEEDVDGKKDEEDGEEVSINGVCVMNSSSACEKNKEEEEEREEAEVANE